MDIYSLIFLFHLVGIFAITFLKLYNVLHKGEKYDWRMSVILFVAFWIFWFFGFAAMTTLTSAQITDVVGAGFESTARPFELIYSVLFSFSNLFILFNFVLFIIEIFFYIGQKSEQAAKSFMSNKYFK